MTDGGAPLLTVDSVAHSFGAVRALAGVSLEIRPGQRIGLVGHNGAGKSTLMNVLLGAITPQSGLLQIDGKDVSRTYSVAAAFAAGVRCVFQELSLCANLSAYENLQLQNGSLRGFGWRRRAADLISASLNRIFPGNSIDVGKPVGALSIGERQMIEIARAFTVVDAPVRLVILDEPTSSLDAAAAVSLMRFVKDASATGVASVFISHRLNEVIESADDIVVMGDGALIASAPAGEMSRARLIELMSGGAPMTTREGRGAAPADRPILVSVASATGLPLSIRTGEIVGLAGLDGHGQRDLLHRIFRNKPRSNETIGCSARLAFVSGDRQREGVFPLWSISRNLTIGSIRRLARFGSIRPAGEARMAEEWRQRLGIRAASMAQPILSLSGGNQQKVLIARALASDASVVLLDDPTRGVDIATKWDLYDKVRQAAQGGRSFLWYTTEFDELKVCDRVCVLSRGDITADLLADEVSENRVIDASFAGGAA